MKSQEKCIVAFNRYLSSLAKEARATQDTFATFTVSPFSPVYLAEFLERNASLKDLKAAVEAAPEGSVDLMSLPCVADVSVFEKLTVDDLARVTGSEIDLKMFLLPMLLIASAYVDADENNDVIDHYIAKLQAVADREGTEPEEIPVSDVDSPFARAVLLDLQRVRRQTPTSSSPPSSSEGPLPSAMYDMLKGTAIGSIAQEVVSELDMSAFDASMGDIKSVEDVFKKMTSSSGGLIGDIVAKVGSKLQNKISSGGLNQADLVREAFSVFGPMMGDVMKNMPNNGTRRQASTRDRLQRKLVERAQNKSNV